jgi:hypothetical protein
VEKFHVCFCFTRSLRHTHTQRCTPTPIALIHPTTLTQTQRVPGIEGTASSGSGLATHRHTHTRTRTHTQTAQKFSQSHIITHSPLHRPHHPQISTPHSQRVGAPQRHQGRWMMPSPPLSKAGLPSTPSQSRSPPSDVTSPRNPLEHFISRPLFSKSVLEAFDSEPVHTWSTWGPPSTHPSHISRCLSKTCLRACDSSARTASDRRTALNHASPTRNDKRWWKWWWWWW